MYCYNCGTPNPDNAPFCTHCNAPLTAPNDAAPPLPNPQPYPPFPPAYAQQPYPYPAMPQQRGLKWWQILLIVLGAILAANVGFGLLMFEDYPSLYDLFSDTYTDDTLYRLNETAVFQDIEVTVTEVKHSGALGLNGADADTEIITVSVNIKNIGDQNLMYDPENYRMINSMGQVIYPHIDYDAPNYSTYYELLPGGQATITLQFEQPIGDTGLELQYYYDYSDKPTLRFEIE